MLHMFHTFHTDPYGHRNWHPTPPTYGLPLTLSTKTLRPSIASWPLGQFSRTWATSTVLFPEALKKSPQKRWVGWMMLDGWMVMVDHLPLGWGFQSHDFEWVLNNSSLHSLASGLMTRKIRPLLFLPFNIHDICKVTASVRTDMIGLLFSSGTTITHSQISCS